MKYQEALMKAQQRRESALAIPVCIVEVIVKGYGWVFKPQSLKYLESGNEGDMLIEGGNIPIIVLKSGEIWDLPGCWHINQFFQEWETYAAGGHSAMIEKLKEINPR